MGNQRIRLILLIAIFSIALVGVQAASRYHAAHASAVPNWAVVPYTINGWTGADGQFDPVYGTDPADTSLLRVYSKGDAGHVIAYTGFYGNLSEILEVHTPELCYPAQGWAVVSSTKTTTGVYRGERIPASEIVVEKDGERRLVTWWYNGGSRPFENRIRYVYGMMALSAFSGRTDGSMVRFETIVDGSGDDAARQKLADFQKGFLPALDQALPR